MAGEQGDGAKRAQNAEHVARRDVLVKGDAGEGDRGQDGEHRIGDPCFGETDVLGKPQGSDLALNKPTYVSIVGIEAAENRCRDLLAEALECIQPLGEQANTLRLLAEYIVCRKH